MWRDKAIELIIRTFNKKIAKKICLYDYFKKYDEDYDAHLTP